MNKTTIKGQCSDMALEFGYIEDEDGPQGVICCKAPGTEMFFRMDEFQVGMVMTALEQLGDRMTKGREKREALYRATYEPRAFPFAKQHTKAAA